MSDPGLNLERINDVAYLNLRGNAGDAAFSAAVRGVTGTALPVEPNTVTRGDNDIFWLGPDEWLLCCESGRATGLAEALGRELDGQHVAINDLSDGLVTLRLTGETAAAVLARGCTLDLDPSAFLVGHCAQTAVAKTNVLLVRNEDVAGFRLVVRLSFADYLIEWLQHAMQ